MEKVAVVLARVRVGELAGAGVRQRHVAGAAVVELLDAGDVGPQRVRVLDADHRDQLALARDAAHVVGGERQPDPVGRVLVHHAVDGVELVDRVLVGRCVALFVEQALGGVDDEPADIQPARLHLGQRDLGGQVRRVVALGGEVRRADVDVGVEGDDAVVDAAGALDECLFRLFAGVVGGGAGEGADPEGERKADGQGGRAGGWSCRLLRCFRVASEPAVRWDFQHR